MVAANSPRASRVTVGPPSIRQLTAVIGFPGHLRDRALTCALAAQHTLPFHGPVAGLRLTRLFGAASGVRSNIPATSVPAK